MPESDNNQANLSPTVLEVLKRFSEALHADSELDGYDIDGLDTLLRSGAVPKPEQVTEALFEPPSSTSP